MKINGKDIQLIAEVKTASPFGWKSDKTWGELFAIAEKAGDIISIHTDPRWEGSFDLIRKAKSLTEKPILAKGIHATDDLIEKAFEAGADFALVVGRIPEVHVEKCLIEPNTIDELVISRDRVSGLKAVWNSRDLGTGGLKKETFQEARAAFSGWLCQASNIKTIDDVDSNADAILVGTNLEDFIASLK